MKSENQPSRRSFLKTSAVFPAALAAGGGINLGHAKTPDVEAQKNGERVLPRRKLGKNGPEVTILNIGGMMAAHGPQFLDLAWKMGIRYFDTADCYKGGQSEKDIAIWLKKYPERRGELFLVTKDHPKKGPEQIPEQIETRLKALQTDYLDLFFIHGLGSKQYKDALNWPVSEELKKVFEQVKASGKVKLCGFSCHDAQLVELLNAAAKGGFVDVIMLRYNPFFKKGDALDRAMDACHEAGIGLVSMKEMRPFAKAPKTNPALEKVDLNTHQAVLHAAWSDPRIASVCSGMENIQQLEENTMAASRFRAPLAEEQRKALKQVAMKMSSPMCPGCGNCNLMAEKLEFAHFDVSRYVTYYEQDGDTGARELYQELPLHARFADLETLEALRDNCQFKVDYPEIVRRAAEYFA